MKILVTGGAGYIGSVITEELIAGGHDVVVLDNLAKGHREAVRPEAKFVKANLTDSDRLAEIFHKDSIDAVIHMAASSLVGESVQKPDEYYQNNVEGGIALLNSMRDGGIKRIVFSSTAAVYGESQKQPIEEDDPTNPTNPYGETKLAFERALLWYSRAYGIRYTSLRYFNAAGATQNCGEVHDPETHLIPAILRVASGLAPHVEVYGDDYPTRDGSCVRDYIHVLDLARAHILALQAQKSGIYNLGCGGEGYSVKEVIAIAREVTGHPIPLKIGSRRPGDPATLIASSDRISRELGWKPQLQNLHTMIESAWKWMQAHQRGYFPHS